MIQSDYAARSEKLRQQAFCVLLPLVLSYRANDHWDDDRHISPAFPVTVVPIYVRVHSSAMHHSTQRARRLEAIDLELMN